jgi:fructan beta-fructosidase
VWVLIASMALPHLYGGHRTQYFLGTFDGKTFRETIPAKHPRILDSGYDDYAAVTFSNADRALLLGWANAWCYGAFVPTNEFCGIMTYARELSLKETDLGLRLAMKPITPEFDLHEMPPVALPQGQTLFAQPCTDGELPGELFQIRVEAEGGFALTLSNDDGEVLNLIISNDHCLVTDRSKAGQMDFSPLFGMGLFSVMSAPRTAHGVVTLDLFFDRMIAETFVDGGTVVNTSLVFPKKPYTRAKLTGNGTLYIGQPRA